MREMIELWNCLAIGRMAGEIQAQFKDRYPLVLVVMGGAVVFAGQLLPRLGCGFQRQQNVAQRRRDGVVFGTVRTIQIDGSLQRSLSRPCIAGVRREVPRQRVVPDLLGLIPADSGEAARSMSLACVSRQARRTRRTIRGVRSLCKQVVEMIRHARRVMDVEGTNRRIPAVGGCAIEIRAIHVAERTRSALVQLLADQVIGRVVLVARIELDHRTENVAVALVQAAGFTRVDQAGGAARDAVRHLVAGDVE